MSSEKVFPVFIALGSNLGDRRGQIETAIDLLAETEDFDVVGVAPIHESDPMYVLDQPSFLNTALVGQTATSPQDLLPLLKSIEQTVGREWTFANGPRIVDLDIIYFGDTVMDRPELTIPHPRRLERDFVLGPIADLRPDFIDPVTGRTVAAHLRDLAESSE